MKNTLIVAGITVVVLAIIGFGIYHVMQNLPGQKMLTEQVGARDHILGDQTTAKVALVEYGDFQCPACGYWYPIVKQLEQDYRGKIIFVFRHFPLPQHANAIPAADAAEAASAQGKFWEMYDLIYSHQADWENSTSAIKIFEGYAQQLGLNLDQFRKDVSSNISSARVQYDMQTGQASYVNSTPSFFLDGAYVQPSDYNALNKLIDDAVNAK